MKNSQLCFIGGGNMAQALIGGQIRAGCVPSSICVVEPLQAQREHLESTWGVQTCAEAAAHLNQADIVVWAVKPPIFGSAAQAAAAHVRGALQLSVMAGISCASIAAHVGTDCVVRTMPNTPALIGQGITGIFASAAVSASQRREVNALLEPMGECLWVEQEADLDAVTALSGSGPAYVFYFIEAMIAAATQMGLTPEQGRQLALATFAGATALARASDEPAQVLRERVTSKGGTTHAALAVLHEAGVQEVFVRAIGAAQARSQQLGLLKPEG
jgi:pyrroline-5-carboxylate reductase